MTQHIKGTGIDWGQQLLGLGVGLLVMLTLTALAAWSMERAWIDLGWMGYLAAGILLTASFVGALTAGASQGRFWNAGVFALGMWGTLLLMHITLFEGDLSGIWAGVAAVLGGSGAAMLTGWKGGRRRGKRRPRRKSR